MTKVFVVDSIPDMRELASLLSTTNIMAMTSVPEGTFLVVAPEDEDRVEGLLKERYGDSNVLALEAQTFVPQNNQPGFIAETLAAVEGTILGTITSALGLHVILAE